MDVVTSQLQAIGYERIEDTMDWCLKIPGDFTLYATPASDERVCVSIEPSSQKIEVQGHCAFNCTYGAIDRVLAKERLDEKKKKQVGKVVAQLVETHAKWFSQCLKSK